MSNLLEEKIIKELFALAHVDYSVESAMNSLPAPEEEAIRVLQDYTKQVISKALPKEKSFRTMYSQESKGYLREDFAAGYNECRSEFLKNLKEQGIIIE